MSSDSHPDGHPDSHPDPAGRGRSPRPVKRRLGRTDLELSSVGLGCWQFSGGGGFVGRYWGKSDGEVVDAIVRASLDGGIDWFDTAEVYGHGRSERALAHALSAAGKAPGEVRIATKWWPLLRTAKDLTRTMADRLACLAPYPVDLHQVHQPYALASVASQMNAMADLVAAGKTRAVGVSNFSADKMRAAHEALAARGLPLASNQVIYSLLDRRVEVNGTLKAAKELGVSIIAYSPLGQGILSAKFHDDPARIAKLSGPRRLKRDFRPAGLARSRPLVEELKAVAKAHGATPSQVALAWLLQFHGDSVLVIPGATNVAHVTDNVAAMHLTLSPRELAALDDRSKVYLG